ncbi:MAG: hypothetical protein SFY95_12770 [Planctomycetota bacterium]|nr:hypothetical protein [Planctomycetota bacterium]
MRVLVDEQAVGSDESSVAGAIRAGVAEAERRGRIIIEAWADGRKMADEELIAPAFHDAGIRELKFISADPRALVRVTLLDAADTLTTIREDQRSASDAILAGKTSEALEALGRCMATWQLVRDSVQKGMDALGLSMADLPGDLAVGPRVADLAFRLGEIRRMLTTQDWSGLADVLAYDMDEQAQAWERLLRGLSDVAASSRGPGA